MHFKIFEAPMKILSLKISYVASYICMHLCITHRVVCGQWTKNV